MAPPPAEKPQILLLSLAGLGYFDQMYSVLLAQLHARATVSSAKTHRVALESLAMRPAAVLVTDAALSEHKHARVCARVIEYARAGGVVVIGGQFSNFVTGDDMDAHFLAWGLLWKREDYSREIMALRATAHPGFRSNAGLHAAFSMKAVTLKGVAVGDVVYGPEGHDRDEASVAHTRVGDGYVGYIGDVNTEEGSTSVILAMCGLPL